MAKADLEKELHVKTMKSSSNLIPKTQAYALIGGTLLLVICAGALLIGWQLGLLPTAETTADGRPQTAEVNIPKVSSAPVDNVALL